MQTGGLLFRLRLRAVEIFSRAWFWWLLAAIFAGRDLLLGGLELRHPDTGTFWSGGRQLLTAPSHLYDLSSTYLAQHHQNPPPGDLGGFISPPPVAYLFAPLALLHKFYGTELWLLLDMACLLAALALLERMLRPSGVARAVYWLCALYFPPLYAEIDAGQLGGPLLLLCVVALRLQARPFWSGAAAGVATALKFYPAALLLASRRRLSFGLGLGVVGGGLLLASFLPLGPWTPLRYTTGVLLPTLGPGNPDCALVSVPMLVSRYFGGTGWETPAASGVGVDWHQLPWALPALARLVEIVAIIGFLVLAFVGQRRAGEGSPLAFGFAFALGALIPGTVFPYAWLTALPLVLVIACWGVEERRFRVLGVLAVIMLGFARPPCGLVVPNLWTIAGIAVFVLAFAQSSAIGNWWKRRSGALLADQEAGSDEQHPGAGQDQ